MLTEKHIRAMGLRPLLHTPDGLWIVEADYPDQIELSEIISIEDNLDESEALIRRYLREMSKIPNHVEIIKNLNKHKE